MNAKQKLAGFKALVKDHQNSSHYFEEMDGSLRPWPELSPESKLHYIAGDAVMCGVPFEQFVEAVQEVVTSTALMKASLQMVLHFEQELRRVEKLLPDDGRTEPMSLSERFKEILHSQPDQTVAEQANDRVIER